MASSDQIRSTIETYSQTFTDDREAWLDLFTEDATVEDPVGTDVKKGREEIGQFWDFAHSLADKVELDLPGPVCVVGQEAAFHLAIVSTIGDARMLIPAIDVMTFDDDAKITSQRAFWTMDSMRPM